MTVKNAEQASELVREFLQKMGASAYISPVSATRTGDHWVVVFIVGLKRMQFEVSRATGVVRRYETLD